MADLKCPSCGNRLPLTAFELQDGVKVEVEIDVDPGTDLTNESQVLEVTVNDKTALRITCFNCPWWAEIGMIDEEPTVTIVGFDALAKLLVPASEPEPETRQLVLTSEPSEYGRG
jgi:hypothetical protein